MTSTPEPTEINTETEGATEAAPATTQVSVAPVILQSTNLALTALQEVTEVETIGAFAGHIAESDTVATLLFECLLPGYPGWRWAASLAQVSPDDPVTVLEVEMLPGDDSLVAPEWVPWAERLAAYRESQAQLAEEDLAADEAESELDDDDDFDDDDDDVMENDYSDFDSEVDGVDIDAFADEELDESDDDADDADDTDEGDDDVDDSDD